MMKEIEHCLKENKSNKPANRDKLLTITIPIMSVFLALLVGSILLLIIKVNPLEAYKCLILGNFTNIYNFSEIFIKATPIILTGIGFTFAFKTGLFNIGCEGQMFAGAIAAVFLGLKTGHLHPFITITICLLGAILAGALWGIIPGILKGIFGSSEIIVTIMFNYVALYLISYLVDKPLREASGFYPQTDLIGENAFLPYLVPQTRLHLGFIIALLFSVLVYLILWKTSFGYKLRAVGHNPDAAEYSGINIRKNIIISLAISGAIAGIAGFTEINGIHHRLLDNFSKDVGFDGIAAALLGNTNPLGVVIASLLLGMLKTGANAMQRGVGVPANIVNIIQALIIIFVLAGNRLKPKIENIIRRKERGLE